MSAISDVAVPLSDHPNSKQWHLTAYAALVRKELLQALPLVGLACGVAVLVLCGIEMSRLPSKDLLQARGYLAMVMPMLFAIASGAVLIGQEKETGSIRWLSWVPVPAWKLVLAKYIGAAIWLVVLSVPLIISWFDVDANYFKPLETFYGWHLFLSLSLSFLVAFLCRNSLQALIVSAALNLGLFSCNLECSYLLEETSSNRFVHMWKIEAIWTIVISVAAFLVGIRMFPLGGEWKWGVGTSSKAWRKNDEGNNTAELGESRVDVVSSWAEPRSDRLLSRSRWGGLLWHAYRNHGLLSVIACLGLLFLFAVVPGHPQTITSLFSGRLDNEKLLFDGFFTISVGLFCLSVLAIRSFAGDRGSRQIRFFSDRGFTATELWTTSILPPISAICFSLLIYTASLWWNRPDLRNWSFMPSPLFVGWACASVFSISLWVTITLRQTWIAGIAAPILSLLGVVTYSICAWYQYLGIGIVLISPLIPFFGSLWLLPCFMNGRRGWRWVNFVTVTTVAYLAPLGFGLWTANQSGVIQVDPSVKQAAFQYADSERKTIEKTVVDDWLRSVDSAGRMPKLSEILERLRSNKISFDEMVLEIPRLEFRERENVLIAQQLAWAVLRYEADSKDPEVKSMLENWIEHTAVAVVGLRKSPNLLTQNTVDAIELELLRCLSTKELRQDVDFAPVARRVLRNQNARLEARKRALAITWRSFHKEFREGGMPASLGSQLLNRLGSIPSLSPKEMLDAVDLFAATLWQWIQQTEANLANRNEEASSRFLREQLHQIRPRQIPFEFGPYSREFRSGPAKRSLANLDTVHDWVGSLWFAAWEEQAKRLPIDATKVNSPKNQKVQTEVLP